MWFVFLKATFGVGVKTKRPTRNPVYIWKTAVKVCRVFPRRQKILATALTHEIEPNLFINIVGEILFTNLKLVVAFAKSQRAKHKHENNSKAVQTLRTGAFILFFEKPCTFPFQCVQIMVTFLRRKVLF